ncbi:MAG: tRNA (5-methylaminomethyl-2-thiouridine)(34)-methyltransferase MnmD [Cyclobacteriaceae bacterium]
MENLRIIQTEDGSHTLRNLALDETYHSSRGAIEESRHVFIKAGLEFVLARKLKSVSILEVGFGTGLNALLTMLHPQKVKIEYHAIEKNPVPRDVYSKLNYPQELRTKDRDFLNLHDIPWGDEHSIGATFKMKKIQGDINEIELPKSHFQLIYFDAFSPTKQPEMWQPATLKKVSESMLKNGVLVTYCSQGQFRRNLRELDMTVEKLPGPPGKFEMVRAIIN